MYSLSRRWLHLAERLTGIFDTGKQVIDHWKGPWISNAVRNQGWIMARLGKGRVYDAPLLPKVLDAPGFILASGPSLDDTPWKLLVEARAAGAGIIAATSNVTAALAHGLIPTHVVVVDANQSVPDHVRPFVNDLHDTILLAPPIADPRLFRLWKGPIGVFKPVQMGDEFIMDVLPKMYSYRTNLRGHERHFQEALTVGFLNAGCYTNGAVLAADFVGYDPLFMIGNDLGFAHGRSRLTTYESPPEWLPVPPHPPISREGLRTANNGLRTTNEFLHYKLNLFIVWRLSQARLYNVSPHGIITSDEVPLTTIEDAIAHWRDLRAHYPLDTESDAFHEHIKTCTERMGLTIVKAGGGLQFNEVTAAPSAFATVKDRLTKMGTVVQDTQWQKDYTAALTDLEKATEQEWAERLKKHTVTLKGATCTTTMIPSAALNSILSQPGLSGRLVSVPTPTIH